jgi:hypothetical protein
MFGVFASRSTWVREAREIAKHVLRKFKMSNKMGHNPMLVDAQAHTYFFHETRPTTNTLNMSVSDIDIKYNTASLIAEDFEATDHDSGLPSTSATSATSTPTPNDISLPLPLQSLFGLNGLSLSLQSLALMYIVNTRVAIPLPYLPTYGAIAFLPYSLKPAYAYLSQGLPRQWLLVGLLTTNFLSIVLTALIPSGAPGVILCFVAAFLRGVTDSWAEFCLGLTLIDHAQRHASVEPYAKLAALFQSQAATARNFGAFVATFLTCLLFVQRALFSPDVTQLSSAVANAMLVTTGLLNVAGALVAWNYQSVFCPLPKSAMFHPLPLETSDGIIRDGIVRDEESNLCGDDASSHPSYSSNEDTDSIGSASSDIALRPSSNPFNKRGNIVLVGLLQLTIIVFSLRTPITEWTSHMAWNVMIISLLLGLVLTGVAIYCFSTSWRQTSHRVGLFLILRHAFPSDSIIMGSFMYSLFSSSPLKLQLLSLVGMAVTTLSSWSYGKLLSKYSSGRQLQVVIAGTTILAGLVSLSNIALVHVQGPVLLLLVALLCRVATSFTGEWSFLPDVVLATTSLSVQEKSPCHVEMTQILQSDHPCHDEDDNHAVDNNHAGDTQAAVAMEYGTLISCIDFGDQLGALLGGPLVAILGISRENNFAQLDHLILVCSILGFLSLGFLGLLNSNNEQQR